MLWTDDDVLVEPGSGRQMRLNPAAWSFAGRCDGRLTVAEIWQALLQVQGRRITLLDRARLAAVARRPR